MSTLRQRIKDSVDFGPGLMLGAGVLLACVVLGLYVDKPAALYIKEHLPGPAYEIFRDITDIGRGEPWYAIALVAWLIARWQEPIAPTLADKGAYRRWMHSAKYMIVAMASSGIVVLLAKPIIGRLRPRYLFENGAYGVEPLNLAYGQNTFPSGHSQAVFSAMVALFFIFPNAKARVVFLTVAVVVAASRAVLTVHFISDVLMGSFLGIMGAIWAKQYFERDGKPVSLLRDKPMRRP